MENILKGHQETPKLHLNNNKLKSTYAVFSTWLFSDCTSRHSTLCSQNPFSPQDSAAAEGTSQISVSTCFEVQEYE